MTKFDPLTLVTALEDVSKRIGDAVLGADSPDKIDWVYIDKQRAFAKAIYAAVENDGEVKSLAPKKIMNSFAEDMKHNYLGERLTFDGRIFDVIEEVQPEDDAFLDVEEMMVENLSIKQAYEENIEDEFEYDDRLEELKEENRKYFQEFHIWKVPHDSYLYWGLNLYADRLGKDLTDIVRNCLFYNDDIYFTSGGGYDFISRELLGGDLEHNARNDFFKIINGKKVE